MKETTVEKRNQVCGRSENAPGENPFGFTETLSLFHALAGLCVGLMWGAVKGTWAGIGACLGGCIAGLSVAFLLNYAPGAVSLVAREIGRKHMLLRLLVVVSGHLIWLSLVFGFWWLCFSVLRW